AGALAWLSVGVAQAGAERQGPLFRSAPLHCEQPVCRPRSLLRHTRCISPTGHREGGVCVTVCVCVCVCVSFLVCVYVCVSSHVCVCLYLGPMLQKHACGVRNCPCVLPQADIIYGVAHVNLVWI